MSEIELHDLHKRYGDHPVLAGLELTVPAGSFAALLGPSGAGKTTLLRLLAGFDRSDRGTIRIGGQTISDERTHLPPDRRRIGYVPQEGSLFPHLNVAANITFGLPRSDRRAAAIRLLELVGLAGLEKRYPHQLSGGQQQRVALARALAIEPEVVLLDEPFASLDAHLRADLRDEVRQILTDSGTTTLLVTHNQEEALSAADTVAVMRDGRIAQHATPHELYTDPLDHNLATFIGDTNLLDGILEPGPDGAAHAAIIATSLGRLLIGWDGDPPAAPCRVSVLIRPEQITLTTPNGSDGTIGRVTSLSYHGHDTLLRIQLETDTNQPPILVRTQGNTQLAIGESCSLSATGAARLWRHETNPSS